MKTEVVYIRVTPDEKARIKKEADSFRLSISEYVRGVALKGLEVKYSESDNTLRLSSSSTSIINLSEPRK